MKPYGPVHDGHQYLLNDNDKRDAAFTKWCRSRERLGARREVVREVVEHEDEQAMRRMHFGRCPCGGADECVAECERCYYCFCGSCGC